MRVLSLRSSAILGAIGVMAGVFGAVLPATLADSSEEPARSFPTMDDPGYVEFMPMGINEIVSASDVAVVARVDAIGEPRWNSADGKAWSATPESYTVPMRYRDAKVNVESVLYDSERLLADPGDTVVVRLYGAGEDSGATIELPWGTTTWNRVSGTMAAGDRVLLLLKRRPFPMSEGPEDAVVVAGHYMGLWQLRGALAVSDDPARTVPVTSLSVVLRRERQAGKLNLSVEQSRATMRDPLAATPGLGKYGALPVDPAAERPPVDRVAASRAIGEAFARVYGYGRTVERLAAVEGGDALLDAWGAPMAELSPGAIPSASVEVTAVFFESPSEASVEYRLSAAEMGEGYMHGNVVLRDGRWLVTLATVCADLGRVGVACPG